MNTRITEAINFNEITSILLSIGYMVYRPEADVDGVDFIVQTPSGDILKCHLKSRAYVAWDRYGGNNIFMVFPSQ